jgi:hypothetical protein
MRGQHRRNIHKNEELAKEWGRQSVIISWKVKKEKYKN